MTKDKSRSTLKKFAPLLIILGGILIMVLMIASRRQPAKVERIDAGALVETFLTSVQTRPAEITAQGTVRPRREIGLAPQVSGKIDWISPHFVTGGAFQAGDVMLRIEEIDYQLAVDQAEATVAQAEYQFSVAQAQADIAVQEWERLGRDRNLSAAEQPKPDDLVLHGPQLKQAEANLASARARLEMARLNLGRTSLRAPFDCRIRDKMADLGQFVSSGQPAARIYSTDMVEIEVRMPMSELGWLDIPGSKATVSLTGNLDAQWEGYVDRSAGVIDSIGRLARAVVRVENPFDSDESRAAELSIGAFVSLRIQGKELSDVVPIPRAALRSDSIVWIALPDSTLEIRRVNVARSTAEEVFVRDGLRGGEQIVLTSLQGAANGTRLRPVLREAAR